MSSERGGTLDPRKLEVHPLAEIFPLMEGPAFQQLVEDIPNNGLREPIVLSADGRVVDGRNRTRACLEAGVEPRYRYDKGDPATLVLSMNVHRRHLNQSQRAMVAARLMQVLAPEARERMLAGRAGNPRANLPEGRRPREHAGALLNVSARLVQHAFTVLHGGDPELIHAVESGKVAVSAAARVIQRRPIQAPPRLAPDPAVPQFRLLYADPPWGRNGLLDGLAVQQICAADAVLFLWTTPARLGQALRLLGEWGFHYQSCAFWLRKGRVKERYLRQQYEMLLIADKGRPSKPALWPDSFIGEGVTRHADKWTEEIYAMIERMFPRATRASLFGAPARQGWERPVVPKASPQQ